MADRFMSRVVVVLPAGGSTTLPHDIIVNGVATAPQIVLADRMTTIQVDSTTDTEVTYSNPGKAAATAEYLCWFVHSIQATPGNTAPGIYYRGGTGGGSSSALLFGDGSDGPVVIAVPDPAQVSILNATTLDIAADVSPPLGEWLVFRASESITVRAGVTIDSSGLSGFAGVQNTDAQYIGVSIPSGSGGGGGGGGGTVAGGSDGENGSIGGILVNGYTIGIPGTPGALGAGGGPSVVGGDATDGTQSTTGVVIPAYKEAGKLYPGGWTAFVRGGFQGGLNARQGGAGGTGGDAGAGVGGAGGVGGTIGLGGTAILLIASSIIIEPGAVILAKGAAGGNGVAGAVGGDATAASGAGGGGGGGGGTGGGGGCGGFIGLFYATITPFALPIDAVDGGVGGIGGAKGLGGVGDGAGEDGGNGSVAGDGQDGSKGMVVIQAIG